MGLNNCADCHLVFETCAEILIQRLVQLIRKNYSTTYFFGKNHFGENQFLNHLFIPKRRRTFITSAFENIKAY